MDVNSLHECFLATLQSDHSVRLHAEQQLKHAENTVGFLGACLDILDSEQVQPMVKQACSIYFKNKIIKTWGVDGAIDNDEKPIIRDRILFTMVKLEKTLRNQFIQVLSVIIAYDYPANWTNFLPSTLQLVSNQEDINSLYVGILCFAELSRTFRWRTNEKREHELDPIISQYFPSLLTIANQLILNPSVNDLSYEASEIVKLVLKCYKYVTYLDFPMVLQQQQNLVDWITFHVAVINMELPQSVLKLPEDERPLNGWCKSQKWAFANLFRLFERYGTPSMSQKFAYDAFRENFVSNVLPQLLNVIFMKLELWRHGNLWISKACLYFIIQFFEQCTIRSNTWSLIKPHINIIISEIAFNIFRPTDETLEIFENDPEEYIHMILDVYEESNSPQTALISFLFTLVEKRSSSTIQPLLEFIYGKLNESSQKQETLEVAKDKEAAMRILGPIAFKLTSQKSQVVDQMENFLSTFIFPNFKSQFSFLRARTCNVSSKFDNLGFTNQANVNTLFQGVMSCFNELDELPIQIEAALAIQSFIKLPEFNEALGEIIVPTMEQLLELSNKFDSDVVPIVMQECVESFSEQLEPFGENLMLKLSEQALRLLNEMSDAANTDVNDYDVNDDFADKQTATLGIFNTMITVLLYFENSSDMIDKLEVSYAPVIQTTFRLKIDDFYAEASELIENTLFLTRSVSPIMWTLFEDFVMSIANDDIILYLEDSLPALKNYLVYGSNVIKQNKQYQDAFMQLIMNIFNLDCEEDDVGSNDIIEASDLATNFILSLNSEIGINYIPQLITKSLTFLSRQDKAYSISNYRIQNADIIIASLIIDPNITLKTLIESNSLETFLELWFNLNNKLRRVFDLKLSLLGYMSLLSIDLNSLNDLKLNNMLPQCGSNIAKLFNEIPQAIKNMEDRRKEFDATQQNAAGNWGEENTFKLNDDDDEEEEDFGEYENNNADFDDAKFISEFENEGSGGSQFKFYNADDDELEEDPYSNTLLDHINIFNAFKNFIVNIQSNEVEKYGLIVGSLTAEEQSVLSKTVEAASL